jgi:hypothetical protein
MVRPPKPKRVFLTAENDALAIDTARKRMEANAATRDRKVGAGSGSDYELTGMRGELAFCQWARSEPDLRIGAQSKGFDTVAFGVTIDVKSVNVLTHNLLVEQHKRLGDSQVYVLVFVDEHESPGEALGRECRIIGWLHEEDALDKDRLRPMRNGYAPTYRTFQWELNDISRLAREGMR